ncbi:transcription termination factor Rho [Glutamicibacter uratoxydans]|uniref:transcription termination factor Rho n=1 Tax=Glutamicibacter uratoxydans TaxID=43667 RepID=UPI003D6E1D40
MTETTSLSEGVENKTSTKSAGLASLKMVQLQQLASQLGITGGSRLRKAELVAAIADHQRGGAVAKRETKPADAAAEPAKKPASTRSTKAAAAEATEQGEQEPATRTRRTTKAAPAEASTEEAAAPAAEEKPATRTRRTSRRVTDSGKVGESATAEQASSAQAPATPVAAGEPSATSENPSEAEKQPATRTSRTRRTSTRSSASEATTESAAATEAKTEDETEKDASREERSRNRNDRNRSRNSRRTETAESAPAAEESEQNEEASAPTERSERSDRGRGRNGRRTEQQDSTSEDSTESDAQSSSDRHDRNDRNRNRRDRNRDRNEQQDSNSEDSTESDEQSSSDRHDRNDRNRNRRDRNRERNERNQDRNDRNNRNRRNRRGDNDEPQLSEDDVLLPIAGILDVLENYAFVRTSGYLPGNNDVYVTLGQVKKYNLRKGDAIVGAIRQPREGEAPNPRQKFNALVQLTSVNGKKPEDNKERVEFNKLVPLYPTERLRLETEAKKIGPRVIDLVAPIGKGQRGLIVSPPKAGKTLILQSIANAITINNPEVHLMMVLVDERPEEVTDMQRTVKGEVIASTFDRPADDHTTVAELAIERAKRLVEMGMDVVVLLDSMTRLGRAYNLAAPASGRILSGGVDSAALYPPKRFFGAARNIENGGSLTILATALVETGSKMDEVIFEEFKGTGNMELRLSRQLAEKRIFPAVDVNASSTRREESLLSGDEVRIMWRLRRMLAGLDTQQALELLTKKIRDTESNAEFLMLVNKTTPQQN